METLALRGRPREASQALPAAESAFGRSIQAQAAEHQGRSGFRLLSDSSEAFAARAELIRNAQRSLDLQYYIVHDGISTRLLVSELLKARLNRGQRPDLYFWRDSTGNEVDVLIEHAQGLQALEIKSGSTFASDWTDGLKKWQKFAATESIQPSLVYGGTTSYVREGLHVWGWQNIGDIAMGAG